MKKIGLYLVLGCCLVLVGCAIGLAAQNVGNASQKGSLLIFPRIDTTGGRDTIVRISNDYPRDVQLHCNWVDANRAVVGFEFLITGTQPIWFRASDGLGTGTHGSAVGRYPVAAAPFHEDRAGQLICWAVNSAGTSQIAWNHLYGTAMIIDSLHQTAYEYNSVNFTVRAGGSGLGDEVAPPGDLILSARAGEYDACPRYLIFNFFSSHTISGQRPIGLDGELEEVTIKRNNLTLVPCHQDLRQDGAPTCTKAKFDVWNENEVKFSAIHQCLKCWFEGTLHELGTATGPPGGIGGATFAWKGLNTTLGRFRVQGVASTVCRGVFKTEGNDPCWTDPSDTRYRGQVPTPFLGLLITEVADGGLSFLASTGFGAGTAPPVHILWDHADPTEEAGRR